MTSLLADLTRDKRILLLGFGKEGRSTYKLLKEICTCSVLDIADIALEESIRIRCLSGKLHGHGTI